MEKDELARLNNIRSFRPIPWVRILMAHLAVAALIRNIFSCVSEKRTFGGPDKFDPPEMAGGKMKKV